MKNWLLIALSIALCFALAGCGGGSSDKPVETPQAKSEEPVKEAAAENSEVKSQEASPEEISAEKKEASEEPAYEVTYNKARTYKNSIGTIWAQTIFEITNTGSVPLYLSSGNCDLEDADGKLIKSLKMVSVYPVVIEVGEKAYYYDETTLEDVDNEIELVALPRPNIKKAKVDNIRLAVTDVELSDDKFGGIRMKGRVENTTDEAQTMVYVAAILFNENKEPIGQVFTILMEELAAGDKIGFEQGSFSLPDDITVDDVASYEIFAYPQQYQF